MRATQDADFPHLATEVRLIEDALARDLPVLGICLGAQLVARALGAAVFPNDEKEIGWYDVSFTQDGRADPLFSHFRETEPIFQWHGDTFELPAGALHLATSATCENQAFRYGESVYGLQFHLEVDQRLIERWLTVPVHLEELADLVGRVDPERIRCETRAHIERTKLLSFRSFVEFIRRFGAPCQRSAHPHR